MLYYVYNNPIVIECQRISYSIIYCICNIFIRQQEYHLNSFFPQPSIWSSQGSSGAILPRIYYVYQCSPISTNHLESRRDPTSFFLFIYLAVLGLRWCTWAFSRCNERGLLLRCGARASHCSGFSRCRARALGVRASAVVARRLSSCGARA